MVTVWRDFRLGYRQVGWGYTFDGGATWIEGGLFDEPNYVWQSDPGVTADADGNFYAIVLSYVSTSQENGLYVFKSTDGGVSWGPPLEVINQYPGAFEDKEFIACDRTDSPHSGNLYVTWTRFGGPTRILFRRSTDSGEHWSGTVTVSDDSSVQFPIPVVGCQGEVYVAWTSYYHYEIRIDRSADGGVSFGGDRTVTNVYTPSTVLNGGIDAYSSPHMDADISAGPFSGRLYAAFMDRRNGLHDFDIWVTASDDMGVTWTTPVRINDDSPDNGRDQFHPWLVVDDQGIVTVVFLDRRHDAQNRTYHCYLAQSFDGGLTWEPNEQVSSQPSDPSYAAAWDDSQAAQAIVPQITQLRAGLLGEYIGVTAWGGRATPIWTDIRDLNQDAYAGYLPDGQGVDGSRLAAVRPALRIFPNPVRSGGEIRLCLGCNPQGGAGCGGQAALRIVDLAGRVIRTWDGVPFSVDWDDLTAGGRRVAAGAYFLQLNGPSGQASTRIIVID